jgi:DNA-binding MarR family transcriptional regulator
MATRTNRKLAGADLETWSSYLLATRLLFDRLDRSLLETAGISLPDFIVLFRLAQAGEDGMRMSELADAGVFSRSRISHAFSRLEKEGWVERRSCPTDRRGSFGFLTESGRLKLEEAEPSHTEVIASYFLDAIGADDSAALNRVTGAMRLLLSGDPNEPAC